MNISRDLLPVPAELVLVYASPGPMPLPLANLRTSIAALGILASCLLAVAGAEGASHAKAYHRSDKVRRRIVSPEQAFKCIAKRRPEKLVRRHVAPLVRKARTTARGDGDDAAIQTISSVTLEADSQASPAFEPIAVLAPREASLRTHHGPSRRAPRGPPALG